MGRRGAAMYGFGGRKGWGACGCVGGGIAWWVAGGLLLEMGWAEGGGRCCWGAGESAVGMEK